MKGDVLVYKVSEISPGKEPHHSGWRCGKVLAFDAADQTLQIEPWPDASVHPLLETWADFKDRKQAELQVSVSSVTRTMAIAASNLVCNVHFLPALILNFTMAVHELHGHSAVAAA